MDLVLISGLSGSGKSVALRLLEDSGYYCVDNLPVAMLTQLTTNLVGDNTKKAAVAIDARSGNGIQALPAQLETLEKLGLRYRLLYLDARDEVLLKRFSETRRKHPLGTDDTTLIEAIRTERDQVEPVARFGHRVDTSDLKANALRTWVRQFIDEPACGGLTLLFQSFGFKNGLPLDADLVFDVRCLPNPHYEPALQPLTGKDQPVADFLATQPDVLAMRDDIHSFVARWLPAYIADNRSYLTVAIGCTGGQHRSVFIAEWLAHQFKSSAANRVLVRHRSISASS
jgi:RNase adapter protein RapZ